MYMPEFVFRKTVNITPRFLRSKGINTLLLDVDNTLATHGSPLPAKGILDWLELMHKSHIKLVITSNNFNKRVAPFARSVGLDYVSFCAKPTPVGFLRAIKKLGAKKHNTLVVGDQIFTDIFGAHLLGIRAALVLPIQEHKGLGFDIKRKFEKRYIDLYLKEKGEFL